MHRLPPFCTFTRTRTCNTNRQPRQPGAQAEALLPVKSRRSVLLLIPLSEPAIHSDERERARERGRERIGGRGECGEQVMAEGAKMVGASQGRAQQRALAQEGEKGKEERLYAS